MNIDAIILPVGILAVIGAIFGVVLSIASRVFAVETDEKVEAIRNALPGANCGACGFPGCDGLAQAIADGKATVSGCSIGGKEVADDIAEIMGVNAGDIEKEVACVLCQGSCGKAKEKYNYNGFVDCRLISDFQKGSKSCNYGCVGGGTCVSVCEFDAIHIVDGIAVVDKEKCVACKKCVDICPKHLIEMVPYKSKTVVKCFSNDIGKVVRANCSVGCISCNICEKSCPKDAIHVENNIAKIDYDKCINCGICVAKCPTGAIFSEYPERVEKIKEKQKLDAEKKKQELLKQKAEKDLEATKNN
ncbi:electron transport complex, RnfABCDGE type, B subunit [Anaerosphaera aminiphila DSM 21120]|uniref:Ion-translocating oxidoreductase complex subunit B n=1 Tax=Anaerosphaera aminiphila DSM 21120 TaxID=1120995 RepID=A0A1M5PAD7_9FIRM|nr:RnfABCDGE type electron transport complex subunit B [Anaerosphaera aminiphila]SHG98801.1 electron transport complex, RnfABCDGE type, B subunit [Anaerosphaera aminiphila DSM 21120]